MMCWTCSPNVVCLSLANFINPVQLFENAFTMKSHGPWKIKKTNEVYEDSFVKLWVDEVIRPDGDNGQHVVVSMKPGVCVIAHDDDFNLYLTNEFHYGIGRDSVEGVSGGIEPGEDPDLTAHRELQEELGLKATHWNYITTVDPFTTCMVSPTRIYFATGLHEVEPNPEGTEQIQRVTMPLDEAVSKIFAGEITHAPTCSAILLLQIQRSK